MIPLDAFFRFQMIVHERLLLSSGSFLLLKKEQTTLEGNDYRVGRLAGWKWLPRHNEPIATLKCFWTLIFQYLYFMTIIILLKKTFLFTGFGCGFPIRNIFYKMFTNSIIMLLGRMVSTDINFQPYTERKKKLSKTMIC